MTLGWTDERVETYVGQIDLNSSQTLSLNSDLDGASHAVASGPASIEFEYLGEHDEDDNLVSSESHFALKSGDDSFTFNLPGLKTLVADEAFHSPEQTGQPVLVRMMTEAADLIDVKQDTGVVSCSIPGCIRDADDDMFACDGTQTMFTLQKKYRRSLTAEFGTPESTRESFAVAAVFTGVHEFVTEERDYGPCR